MSYPALAWASGWNSRKRGWTTLLPVEKRVTIQKSVADTGKLAKIFGRIPMNDLSILAPRTLRDLAFDRLPDPPGGVVAEVRGLLQGMIFTLLSDVGSKLTQDGFEVIHGYEDLTGGDCRFRCHHQVGRAYLLVRDADRSAKITFTGCANLEAESWMVECHISFNRMPPPYVTKCLNADEIESFATRELSSFLLPIARYRQGKYQLAIDSGGADFWDDFYQSLIKDLPK